MSGVIRWEEPPVLRESQINHEYEQIAEQLKTAPGRWARVFEAAGPGFVGNLSSGRLKAFKPKGAFQARSERNPDGKTRTVWIRYVGTEAGQ